MGNYGKHITIRRTENFKSMLKWLDENIVMDRKSAAELCDISPEKFAYFVNVSKSIIPFAEQGIGTGVKRIYLKKDLMYWKEHQEMPSTEDRDVLTNIMHEVIVNETAFGLEYASRLAGFQHRNSLRLASNRGKIPFIYKEVGLSGTNSHYIYLKSELLLYNLRNVKGIEAVYRILESEKND